jgi:hypothetical protein
LIQINPAAQHKNCAAPPLRLNHLDANLRRVQRRYFDELCPEWQQEFEADAFGLQVTLACLARRGMPADAVIAGIAAFFVGLDLVERTICRFLDIPYRPDAGSLTHPPAELRFDKLRQMAEKLLGPEVYAQANFLKQTLRSILLSCVPKMDEFVDELKSRNVKIHPKWHA